MLVPDANVERKRMLVTKMAKTVTNILKLSPTHSVSNIRHQHRCCPLWFATDGLINPMKLEKNQIHFKTQTVLHDPNQLTITWDYLIVQETVGKTQLFQNTGSSLLVSDILVVRVLLVTEPNESFVAASFSFSAIIRSLIDWRIGGLFMYRMKTVWKQRRIKIIFHIAIQIFSLVRSNSSEPSNNREDDLDGSSFFLFNLIKLVPRMHKLSENSSWP